jgi:hypothetical protein
MDADGKGIFPDFGKVENQPAFSNAPEAISQIVFVGRGFSRDIQGLE